MLSAGGRQFEDWSAAYRLFEFGRFDRQALFNPIRRAVLDCIPREEPLVVMMDDTLLRKRGGKVHGTGWRRDPLGPHFCSNFVWAQRFLQLSAALPDSEVYGRARGIPLDFIHAPSAVKPKRNVSDETLKEYRREQEEKKISNVAAKRLRLLREEVRERRIVCSVDGGFTNSTLFHDLPDDTVLIGRVRKDARLFKVPSEDGCLRRRGRKRFYGEPLPTPENIRKDSSYPWIEVEAYAAGKRQLFEIKTLPAVRWRGSGERTVRLIVVRPLAYRPRKGAKLLYRSPAYLLCTDPSMSLEDVLQAYLWRWEIEVNFRDEKTVLGVGDAQVRKASSVEGVPSLIVAAYAYLLLAGSMTEGWRKDGLNPKWRNAEPSQRCSTQQMVALFRTQTWRIAIQKNLRHFDAGRATTQSHFYYYNSLASAIFYARK